MRRRGWAPGAVRAAGARVGVALCQGALRGVPRGHGGRRVGEAAPGVPPRLPRRVHRRVAPAELDVPGLQVGGEDGAGCGGSGGRRGPVSCGVPDCQCMYG